MLIVAGKIYVRSGTRAAFLAASEEAMRLARRTQDCVDFVVAADPLEPNRVNVYEAWANERALEQFRGEGPGEDLSAMVERADVSTHRVAGDNAD